MIRLQLKEEEDHRQWTRVEWFLLGDSNSSFFNVVMKECSLCNSHLNSINPQGRVMGTKEDLTAEGISYYFELFRETPTSNGS